MKVSRSSRRMRGDQQLDPSKPSLMAMDIIKSLNVRVEILGAFEQIADRVRGANCDKPPMVDDIDSAKVRRYVSTSWRTWGKPQGIHQSGTLPRLLER